MLLNHRSLYEFGAFRLDASERTLWRDGLLVPLTPKAFETLAILVEHRGKLLEKEALLSAVWPDSFVEEGNLAVQISLLRKTLGEEGFIETVPRRGYRFVAPVREILPEPTIELASLRPPMDSNAVSRRGVLAASATAVALASGAGVWWFRVRQPVKAIPFRSLAVLPFRMLAPNPGDEQLGLGLTDAVITRFGGLNKCIVRPTSAIRQFEQVPPDPVAAGKKLDVDAVLDASVQTQADKIRVNAQLVRVQDGQHLWAETFDLKRADLFTLEDELATRFLRSLFGTPSAMPRYQPKPEAFRLYLLGKFHRNRWNSAGQRKAIEYFEQAVIIDPGYAAAHAANANAWSLLAYFFGIPTAEAYPKSIAAAETALRLDDQLSDAHHSMGAIRLFLDWDWQKARHHFQKALELNPNNVDSHHAYGVLNAIQKKQAEGIASLHRALEIEPASAWRHVGLAFQYGCAKRLEEAVEELKKAHELEPALGSPMQDLFFYLTLLKKDKEAVEWHLKLMKTTGSEPEAIAAARATFEKGGMDGYLRNRIGRFEEQIRAGRRVSPILMSKLYSVHGDIEKAVSSLEESYKQRDSLTIFIGRLPLYDVLRGNTRFQALVQKMSL